MHIYSKIFLFIACVFLGQTKLFAIEVSDLYIAHVPVSSKAETEKKRALKEAMKGVILKVAGQVEALSNPLVKQSINQYTEFYTRFYYQTINDENVLTVTFDENKINAALEEAELPVWGSLRPKILLWIVNENGFARSIVPASSEKFIPEDIAAFSKNRGLPFVLPAVDEVDQELLTTSDLWGRFSEPTLVASTRYGAESVAIIRLSNSNSLAMDTPSDVDGDLTEQDEDKVHNEQCIESCSSLDWRFISNGQVLNETFSYQGKDEKILLSQALEDMTEQVYKRYALTSNEQQAYEIDVANIDSLNDYIKVSEFLSELHSVKAVTLVKVEKNNRRFNLTLIGSAEAFLATLKLDKNLTQYIDPLADIDVSAPPVFYWKKD